MLGREVNTPVSLVYRPLLQVSTVNTGTYVTDLEERIQCAHETACRCLNTSEERMKKDFDLKPAIRPFHEGDLVYMLNHATAKGKCRKLSPSWNGHGINLRCCPIPLPFKTKTAAIVANHDHL